MKYVSLAVSILLLALMPIANAQTVTGQITGTVVDSAGAVVNRMFPHHTKLRRWSPPASPNLVQIAPTPQDELVDSCKK